MEQGNLSERHHVHPPELVRQSEQPFAGALELVQDDPVLLRRVKIAHLRMQYLVIKRALKLWPAVQQAIPDANFATCRLYVDHGE